RRALDLCGRLPRVEHRPQRAAGDAGARSRQKCPAVEVRRGSLGRSCIRHREPPSGSRGPIGRGTPDAARRTGALDARTRTFTAIVCAVKGWSETATRGSMPRLPRTQKGQGGAGVCTPSPADCQSEPSASPARRAPRRSARIRIMTTGWVHHELYMWHDTGRATTMSPERKWMQAWEHYENPETKRRFRNLVEVAGLFDDLVALKPRMATV